MADDVHPVNQFLPVPKLLTLGLQHVLVMYAGALAHRAKVFTINGTDFIRFDGAGSEPKGLAGAILDP